MVFNLVFAASLVASTNAVTLPGLTSDVVDNSDLIEKRCRGDMLFSLIFDYSPS